MLQQKRLVEEAVWSNPQIRHFISDDDAPVLSVTLIDLVKTLQQVLERTKDRPVYRVNPETVSVPDMIRYLQDLLKKARRGETFAAAELFERQESRRAMICLFLAILELVKRQALQLTQRDSFGDIGLCRHENFDEALGSEEALATIEQEYS